LGFGFGFYLTFSSLGFGLSLSFLGFGFGFHLPFSGFRFGFYLSFTGLGFGLHLPFSGFPLPFSTTLGINNWRKGKCRKGNHRDQD
jgi:hypothetical protein